MCRLHVGRKRRGKREKQVNAAAGPTQRGRESGARFTLLLSFLASSPRLFSWIVAQERYSMYQFKIPCGLKAVARNSPERNKLYHPYSNSCW